MDIEMLNRIIEDVPEEERHNISDGNSTFGELYSENMLMYATIMKVFSASMTDRLTESPIWVSLCDTFGQSKEGFMWLGIKEFEGAESLCTSMEVPIEYWDNFVNSGAEIIKEALEPKGTLAEVLNLFVLLDGE